MYTKLRSYNLIKQAGTGWDIFESGLGDAWAHMNTGTHEDTNRYLASLKDWGAAEGLKGELTLDDIVQLNKLNLGFLPGMTAFKTTSKQQALENLLSKKERKNKSRSEHYGRGTSVLLSSLLGGAGGALFNPFKGVKLSDNDKTNGRGFSTAAGGLLGGVGGGLANLGGLIAAQLTPGRTEADQAKYYDKSDWANWLIPGVAEYNRSKTIGLADRMVKALERAGKSKKKK